MAPLVTQCSYDEFPYASYPYPDSCPDNLAVVATLLGLSPPSADRCRVLELGCGAGGNLIPLAYAYPESSFVAIDLSCVQIGQAEALRKRLNLENITFRAMSILDVDDRFGTFDFVICHGVYSWVPDAVQDKILDICARHLAPQGIGYVSYNTLPGWHMKGMVRSMMVLHDCRYQDRSPQERVGQSRALLNFLADAFPENLRPYPVFLRDQRNELNQFGQSYVFHEYLEERNTPVYFSEFCRRLAAKRLRYLGEAQFWSMIPNIRFASELMERLGTMAPSLLEKEQYADLLRNRQFRQTLICHAGIQPDYDVHADRLASFKISACLKSAHEPDFSAELPKRVTSELGKTPRSPIVKAALGSLDEVWPKPLAFEDIVAKARSRLGDRASGNPADDGAGSAPSPFYGLHPARPAYGNSEAVA